MNELLTISSKIFPATFLATASVHPFAFATALMASCTFFDAKISSFIALLSSFAPTGHSGSWYAVNDQNRSGKL